MLYIYIYKCYKLETFIGFIQKIQNCLSKKLILTLANTKTCHEWVNVVNENFMNTDIIIRYFVSIYMNHIGQKRILCILL